MRLLENLLPEFFEARLTTQLMGMTPRPVVSLEVRTQPGDRWRRVGALKVNPAGHVDLYPDPRADKSDLKRVKPHTGGL